MAEDPSERFCTPPPRPEGELPAAAPPGAPEGLEIRSSAPTPMTWDQADLGIAVDPVDGSGRRHRLVVLGDSLTHGFKSLAITDTHLSWPMMVARAMGLVADYDGVGVDPPGAQFTFPRYPGPAACPGLPINLEGLLRALEADVADTTLRLHEAEIASSVLRTLHAVADYWNDGPGADPLPPSSTYHHNLAVWGYDVRDALSRTRASCESAVADERSLVERLGHLGGEVRDAVKHRLQAAHANDRSGLRTLWGPDPGATQVSAATALGADGGIETLVVALGANNALGSVVDLELRWSQDDYADLSAKGAYNVWAPAHFAHEYTELVAALRGIDAAHVVLATVPHVTIAPIARGVGEKPYYSRYFARYTRPWIIDAAFDSSSPSITGDEARAVDAAIDRYNYTIKRAVRDARREGRDWLVFDMCGLLDRLAYRRYLASPQSQPAGFSPYVLPPELLALSPRPDTRFFRSDPKGRTEGGLIALDGVHPTTIGFGIVAQEVVRILDGMAGVAFADPQIDFAGLIRRDTLIERPPALLSDDLVALRKVDELRSVAAMLRARI